MTQRGIDRRTVLRGLLGGAAVSVALPSLELFGQRSVAHAAADGFPTRFGLFWWGNGNHPDKWVPEVVGEGDAWALSPQLAPLAGIKDQLAVVTGYDVFVPNNNPHGAGAAGFLTGSALLDQRDSATYAGPSLDRYLAAQIGGDTRFRSIEYGPSSDGLSYEASHQRMGAVRSPFEMYERLFGAGFFEPGEEPVIDPKWALRRSVLDAVMEDASAMKQRAGYRDRLRLEQHLDGVRELELRLARLELDPPDLASCRRPDAPAASYPDIDGRPQIREVNRVMSQLAAMACACDQTRVVSNWFTSPVSDVLFPGAPAGHHQLTHDEPGAQPNVDAIVQQVLTSYADMVEAFRAIPEGDGTLLDHSVILACSEVSLGRTHSIEEMPILLAGSAGGALKTNVHVRSSGGRSTSEPTLSVIRALGVNAASWGTGDNLVSDGVGDLEQA